MITYLHLREALVFYDSLLIFEFILKFRWSHGKMVDLISKKETLYQSFIFFFSGKTTAKGVRDGKEGECNFS